MAKPGAAWVADAPDRTRSRPTRAPARRCGTAPTRRGRFSHAGAVLLRPARPVLTRRRSAAQAELGDQRRPHEAACAEARELIPGITTTAVKKGLSRNSAISLSAKKSHQLIRQDAVTAVQNHKKNPIQPLVWPGPFVLEKRFFHSHFKDGYATNPAAEIIDSQTVRIRGDSIRDVIYF